MGCERFFGCNRSFETFPNAMRASCFLGVRDDRIFVFLPDMVIKSTNGVEIFKMLFFGVANCAL